MSKRWLEVNAAIIITFILPVSFEILYILRKMQNT